MVIRSLNGISETLSMNYDGSDHVSNVDTLRLKLRKLYQKKTLDNL